MWTRWQAVLVAFLAAAAAVAALSVPFHAPWLKVAGLIVAAVGAVVAFGLKVGQIRLEARRERAEADRRLLVPVTWVSEVDPSVIGVDPAVQTVLGGKVPEYVPRTVDAELRGAVKGALEGLGAWLVVVVGASKVGKSRALFEALRQYDAEDARLQLLAPVDGDALRSLLEPGQAVSKANDPAVLWLDDIEPFLNQGVTLQTLREWRSGGRRRIVAATYGGKGGERVAGSAISGLKTIADEVLQYAEEIPLDQTSSDEVGPLRSRLPDAEFDTVCLHGLAAYLVAGSLLRRKLTTGRHAAGEDACPEGVAAVHAACDWARCGRTDPITDTTLRTLWPAYLPTGLAGTGDGFRAALGWALRPVAATIALLEHTGSYRAYDYVVRLRREQQAATPPHDAAWTAAIHTDTPEQALAVGVAAAAYSRWSDALAAFGRAAQSPREELVANALVNEGVALGQLDRTAEAVDTYQQVIDRYTGYGSHPTLREHVANALLNQGEKFRAPKLFRVADAIYTYQQVVDRYGDDPALREKVAWAFVFKGVTEGQQDRPAEAFNSYQQVVDRYGKDPALCRQVAIALVRQGLLLDKLAHPEDAAAKFRQVTERYGERNVGLYEQVAALLVGEKLGGTTLIERYGDNPALRPLLETISRHSQLSGSS